MIQFIEEDLGWSAKTERHFLFFGGRGATIEKLKSQFSFFKFFGVKQTHSDVCLSHESGMISDMETADAILGKEPGVAYYLKTADCLPILIFSRESDSILAIHAGWRGIENRIVIKSLAQYFKNLATLNATKSQGITCIVGPHIQTQSFEVEAPIARRLLASAPQAQFSDVIFKESDGKCHVNLSALVSAQLMELGIVAQSIQFFSQDTKSTSQLHSYRRDLAQSGRNISFIARR